MGKFDKLLEIDINNLIAKKLANSDVLVLQEVRLHPCELDLVLLDKNTFCLATIEIKRNNWRYLLKQALRTRLYSHYSIAAMPNSMQSNVPIEIFAENGIGVIFYNFKNEVLDLEIINEPKFSTYINRGLKKQIYKRFIDKYGGGVYA
jgi:hypothetical protein